MASKYTIILPVAVLLAAATVVQLCPTTNTAWRKLTQLIQPPTKTVVAVLTNNLEGHESMVVECKAAATSGSGVQEVAYGDNIKIEFQPDENAYCSFEFNGAVHLYNDRFDVYQNGRDGGCGSGSERSCNWFVKENGPCFHDASLPEDLCLPWN